MSIRIDVYSVWPNLETEMLPLQMTSITTLQAHEIIALRPQLKDDTIDSYHAFSLCCCQK
eukprot:5397566-Amphidinium_carterae.1